MPGQMKAKNSQPVVANWCATSLMTPEQHLVAAARLRKQPNPHLVELAVHHERLAAMIQLRINRKRLPLESH